MDPETIATADFLAGGGEMGELMRAHDWSSTPLGPVDGWPQSLRTSVSTCLNSRFPILVWWGPELVMLYNDAYRPILGTDKHPRALGAPGLAIWPEIWDIIGPMLGGVLAGEEATWSEDQMLPLDRNGYVEECYFTFSYSPIQCEQGGIAGVFTAVTETTRRVLAERRTRTLQALGTAAVEARTVADAEALCVRALESDPNDIPFALLYRFEGDTAHLVGSANVDPGGAAVPRTLEISGDHSLWPLPRVAEGRVEMIGELATQLGSATPTSCWGDAVQSAMILPITGRSHPAVGSALVLGLSPRLPLDAAYREFIQYVGGSVTNALANARAYEAERRRAETLAELDRAKTTFFSNVSHEFRTPLTLMLGPLEDTLARGPDVSLAEVRDDLTVAHRNALRLLKLVNNLLDFSRIEAGRIEASYEPTDLSALTTELASTFRSAVEHAGLRLVVDAPPLSATVYVDPEMWEKIVLNLVSNAFKFTFEGQIEVRVREVDGRAALEVSDTGVGIPAHELPHLFERFHRVEGTRSRTMEGSGIGLSLVQELARLHGGSVGVRSEEGQGTTFTVSIPLGCEHLPQERIGSRRTLVSTASGAKSYVEEASRWVPATEGETTTVAAAGARVLLADDNADMRDYVARLLTQQHYQVDAVADGAAALEAARIDPPDLVLADVMMPQLGGFALLQALRAQESTREVPIILLSARAGEEARIEGLEAGADDYLVKPFGARELLARTAAHLEMSQLRRNTAARERELRQESERARAAAETSGARLREIFLRAPAVIATLRGPDHVYENANPLYLRVVGNRKILGKPIREALPELEGQGIFEILDRVYQTGEPFIASELPVLVDQGGDGSLEEVFFNLVYQPLFEVDGSVSGIFVHAVEVTDQVRARRQVDQARAEAEEANEAKTHFLASMSHELRTPLNAIAGYVDLLELGLRGPLTDSQRDDLERIKQNQQLLLSLINDVLNFAKIEAGHLEIHRAPVALDELLNGLEPLIGPQVRAKGMSYDFHPCCRGLAALGDADRIRQILLNLLTNAVKFSSAGDRVGVSADALGEEIAIRVSDTGPGIPPEKASSIFDPFVQVDRRRHLATESQQGVGLGLAISRELARAMGGDLVVESALGQGSTFTLTLPSLTTEP